MKQIHLTQGQVALVDDQDFERFGHLKWCANKKKNGFYAYRTTPKPEKNSLYLHREILGVTDPRVKVDHKNHDTLDNRRENLRECTTSQNTANRKGPTKANSCGIRGVRIDKRDGAWMAEIRVGGKHIYIGRFRSKKAAGIAYAVANRKHFGEFGGNL